LATKNNEILSPKQNIKNLLMFNPDLYQNLYIIHNLERGNLRFENDLKEKFDSANRRVYLNDCINNDEYRDIESNKDYNKMDYSKKYNPIINYKNYDNSIKDNTKFDLRPISYMPENNYRSINKETERFRNLEYNENGNENKITNNRRNYLADINDDDFIMSSINIRNDLGNLNFSQENNSTNLINEQLRMQVSETANLIRGDSSNNNFNNEKNEMFEDYRFKKERGDFYDISKDNNTRDRILS